MQWSWSWNTVLFGEFSLFMSKTSVTIPYYTTYFMKNNTDVWAQKASKGMISFVSKSCVLQISRGWFHHKGKAWRTHGKAWKLYSPRGRWTTDRNEVCKVWWWRLARGAWCWLKGTPWEEQPGGGRWIWAFWGVGEESQSLQECRSSGGRKRHPVAASWAVCIG